MCLLSTYQAALPPPPQLEVQQGDIHLGHQKYILVHQPRECVVTMRGYFGVLGAILLHVLYFSILRPFSHTNHVIASEYDNLNFDNYPDGVKVVHYPPPPLARGSYGS